MIGTSSDQRLRTLLASDAPPGGVFVNESASTRLEVIRSLPEAARPLVAVDDEGGRVQRLKGLLPSLPSAREQAALAPGELRVIISKRARLLRGLGVTVDFAPVVDLTGGPAKSVIGDRSYGTDVDRAVASAGAFADGLRDGGVLPTWKHFPGHGRASGDSHDEVVTTPPLAELERSDMEPYRRLLPGGPSLVMMGHLVTPGLTEPLVPATVSSAAYRYLRDAIGFDGVVITDDLSGMRGITAVLTPAKAVVEAIVAGADMALMAGEASFEAAVEGLIEAVRTGRLTEAGVEARLGRLDSIRPCL
jgi:beta-N-acetylhexosaminidase